MAWWEKERFKDNKPFLVVRNKAKTAIRIWFEGHNFTEVETSQLQKSPGNETHLLGLKTIWNSPNGQSHDLYFATSPEFSCKKLIAAGETKIFEFARVFRDRDIGPLHSPEFTMLEWYHAGADWHKIIDDTLEVCKIAALSNNCKNYNWKNLSIPIGILPIKMKVTEAFEKFADIDLLKTLDENGVGKRDEFAALATEAGINIDNSDDWSDIFTKVLVAKIEPNLGIDAPTIIYEYPYPEAALARRCNHDRRFVERFELYICGIEIANGFGELNDAKEQKARFEEAMTKQMQIYGRAFPIDEELLDALGQMPQTSGVALGFERLIMLISGARKIEDVLWTPFPINYD